MFDERVLERYLTYRARKQSIQPGDRAALTRLLSVLRDTNVIPPAPLPPIPPEDQIFGSSQITYATSEAWPRSPSSATCQSFAGFYARCALPAPSISARSDRTTSFVTSNATPTTQVWRPGRRCAHHCGRFYDTSSTTGQTRSLLQVACLPSGTGSLQICRPTYRLLRFRRFSMLVIERPA